MFQLVIEDDSGRTTVVPLPPSREEITIGRKEGNTIRLIEQNISRFHARLVKSPTGYFIEDKGSYNGTKVNGDRITGRRFLKENDQIALGDYRIFLKIDKEKEAKAQAQSQAQPEKSAPAQEAPKPANNRPRLCLISGPLAGKMFQLQQDEILLGRTDENDIILTHPSISRNHAKISVQNGTYHIVDLGSANGVRVNGEEFGKSSLKPGDKVDLGHVRLRFIAPGEDFSFHPSMIEDPEAEDAAAQAAQEAQEGGSLRRWWRSLKKK
jgi:pSer/pThr/pTyr-binding forkhead associated (FHA) protein